MRELQPCEIYQGQLYKIVEYNFEYKRIWRNVNGMRTSVVQGVLECLHWQQTLLRSRITVHQIFSEKETVAIGKRSTQGHRVCETLLIKHTFPEARWCF